MQLTLDQKYKLNQFTWSTLVGIFGGFLYTLAEDGWEFFPLFNGTLAGFTIGVVVSLLELFLFAGPLRRIPFVSMFFLRVALYFLLAVAITFNLFLFSRTIKYDLSFSQALYSEEFQHYLREEYHLVLAFCFIAIALSVFTLQMARKLGLNDLLAFISGRYRSPKKELRIFMFISLGGSDKIISKTGNIGFHNFINDFIFDISNTIRLHRGKIVHYMEDEIVITWKAASGMSNANCVRMYFDLCHTIVGHFEYYHAKYGLLPKPKCAVHAGNVIKAEIGEVKSEISFFGDVVNTTSRVLDEAEQKGMDILVTQPVMEMIQLPVHFKAKSQGDYTPRGKHSPIKLYSLHLQHE